MEAGIQLTVVSSLEITLEIEEILKITKTFTNPLLSEVHNFINKLLFKVKIWTMKMTNLSQTYKVSHISEKTNRRRIPNSIKKNKEIIISSIFKIKRFRDHLINEFFKLLKLLMLLTFIFNLLSFVV